MSLLSLLLIAGLALFAYVSLIWLASLVLRDASIIDIFWGLGFVLVGWLYFALSDGYAPRQWLLMSLVSIWGLRLSGYLLWRNWGQGEDFRYRQWRAAAGRQFWWRSYFKVFLLQGFFIWIISLPLLAAQIAPAPAGLTLLDGAGVLLWLVGFYFEAVGDWQLARFKANPANRGQVLSQGVWRYTRHPNYFGDACQWWGFYLIALAAGGWWSLFSPLLMTLLLRRVSGVTLLERSLKTTRPGYEAYIATTNAFFPGRPRKQSPPPAAQTGNQP